LLQYSKDCKNKFGNVVACEMLSADFEKRVDVKQSEQLRKQLDHDLAWPVATLSNKLSSFFFSSSSSSNNAKPSVPLWLSLQACEVTKDRKWLSDLRQQAGKNDAHNAAYVNVLIAAYEMLLYLHANHPNSRTTPPVPVDLIWHSHMCFPQVYVKDMQQLLGNSDAMGHSPWPSQEFYGRPEPTDFEGEFGIKLADIVVHPERLGALKVSRAVEKKVCTFTVTQREYALQPWFRCDTCSLNETKGCCQTCASRCHAGHQVQQVSTSQLCFCDCPVVLTGANGTKKCCSQVADASTASPSSSAHVSS